MAGFGDIMGAMGGAVNAFLADMPSTIGRTAESFQIAQPFGQGSGFQVQQQQSQGWQLANPFPNGAGFQVGGVGASGFQVVNPFGGGNPFAGSPDWRNVAAQNAAAAQAQKATTDAGVVGGTPDPSAISDGNTRTLVQNTNKWRSQIEQAASDPEINVDPDALQAIMMIESGGDPNSVSVAGAQGLMQVMPFHFSKGQNPLDPATNIRVGAQVFADAYHRYGNYASAAAAYLGAVDVNGNPTSATDAYGTSGVAYAAKFQAYYQALKAAHTAPSAGRAAGNAAQQIASARQFLGIPYVFGGGIRQTGDPRSGFDCSSFTGYIKGLPAGLWNANAQYQASTKIDKSQLQPGDLVFFQGTYDTPGASHVGIYIGNGQMISAIDSGVGVQTLSDPYWQQHFLGYGRL